MRSSPTKRRSPPPRSPRTSSFRCGRCGAARARPSRRRRPRRARPASGERPAAYFANAPSPATLVAYYRAVADASPVPVLVYNIPKYTHLALAAELLQQLALHPNIRGVKDSSGDVKNLSAYRAALPHWTVLVGSGSLLLGGLELGCDGGVLAVACYAARRCADIFAAFRAGDRGRAGALQEQLGPLDKEIVGRLGPAGVKAAMDAVGLYGGPVRAPLASLAPADRERVAHLVCA